MKLNLILLNTYCLLQVLINLYDKEVFFNIGINYLPLTPDNIQFKFDDLDLLHIKFVNLKPIINGKNI